MGNIRFMASTALALICGITFATSAQAAFPGQNGRIAFGVFKHLELDSQLETITPDGTGRRLLIDPMQPHSPVWAPAGDRLAYVDHGDPDRFGSIGREIFVVNADGTGSMRLTFSGGEKSRPTWSPDGQKIAYVSGDETNIFGQIHVVNADGTGDTVIASLAHNPDEWALDPSWSPDGSKIAFSLRRISIAPGEDGPPDLYTIDPHGGNLTQLTDSEASEDAPSWSPAGTQIAFPFASRNPFVTGIAVINADGSGGQTIVSDFSFLERSGKLAWSPDATKIVFVRTFFPPQVPPRADLFVVNADGSALKRLTDTPELSEGSPDWQPLPGPRRESFKNGPAFCRAEREFLGAEAFAAKYGGRPNAFGNCVSAGKRRGVRP